MISKVVLLGPQRFRPTLASAVQSLGIEGDIATVTAGWQEREDEDAELRDHLGSRAVNLMLHRRSDEVFQADPAFGAAHGLRQERLRQLQRVYRSRLAHLKDAARELLKSEGDLWLLDPEREDAVHAIRDLDAHHMERVREVHAHFDDACRPHERSAIARHREELAQIIEPTAAIALAGGHVAVLLNRLRLFGVTDLAASRPVLAWSAGAMVAAERIVLFHDTPPQGPGNAELLGPGLALFPGVVPFPHARRRLRLEDASRVALLARRFAPAACLALDEGARADWDGATSTLGPGTRTLTAEGRLEERIEA
jgi:hypothetical protein